MGLSRRIFTKEFKLAAVRRLEQGVSIGEAARALEVNPNVLHRWRKEFRSGPGNVFPGHGKQRWAEGRIAELERKIGQQALEIDFLKGCLQQPVGQRGLRVVHENFEVRRGAAQRLPRPGRGSRVHRRVPRQALQHQAAALRAGLHAARQVRSRAQKGSRCAAACCMSFPRHREIYPSNGGASLRANAPAHRADEFPTGYSSAGCSPAEPTSASPAGHQSAVMSSCRSRLRSAMIKVLCPPLNALRGGS